MPERKPYPEIAAQRHGVDSTTNPPTVRAETVNGSVMTAIRARVCRYRCGTCEYESTDRWGVHETHYRGHRDSR